MRCLCLWPGLADKRQVAVAVSCGQVDCGQLREVVWYVCCLSQAVRVYEVMTAAGVEPNGSTYNAALTSYARNNQLESALALFSGMGARGYERGVNSYSAVLSACEAPGR